jgi:hypothetical protein
MQSVTYYIEKLIHNLFSIKGISALLSSFGALWLCVEIANFFFKNSSIPSNIESHWWLFFIFGILVALWICRPILIVREKLRDRDIQIEIAIGDIFKFTGSIVVGSNSTFDTRISRELISENSVQGQFTRLYYDGALQLDAELNSALSGIEFEELSKNRVGKVRRYPLGTVVKLNPRDRTGYFIAIANINEYGVASGSFDALKDCLAELWYFIGERGLKEPLVIPVLGAGYTRLTSPRQIIIQEIIKSFIAACSERTFCEKLTIVICEKDALENKISIKALGDYLSHVCNYTEFSNNSSEKIGVATS